LPISLRHSRSALRRALVIAWLVALAAVVTPARAWGHAVFLDSQPEAGTRLESAPGQITLTFTESLDRNLSEASLVNAETGERSGRPRRCKRAGARGGRRQPDGWRATPATVGDV
jgi:methionine-rich copper-binding protein CopC